MKIKIQKIGTMFLTSALLCTPVLANAAGLVPCGGPTQPACDFHYLTVMANTIINFLLYYVAIPLATLGFMWTGARLIIFQNKENEWSEAKKNFWTIAQGFGIILAAFVLIKFIGVTFLGNGFSFFLS